MIVYVIKWVNKENKESTGYVVQDHGIKLFFTEGDAQNYLSVYYVLPDDKYKCSCDYKIAKVEIKEIKDGQAE